MDKKIENIIKNMLDNKLEILSKIDKEDIVIYLFLKNEYEKGDVENNKLFQFVFRSFYRLDSAGLGNKLKEHYFNLLAKKEINLEKILSELYEIPIRRGFKTIQFSFATKLLHTIDNYLPIYDSKISKILKLAVSGNNKEEKINSCIEVYEKLKEIYKEFLQDKEMLKLINKT